MSTSLLIFIPQETLFYAAMLRLPRSMSRKEKRARVDVVIAALGLERCRGTIVGGFFQRGCVRVFRGSCFLIFFNHFGGTGELFLLYV